MHALLRTLVDRSGALVAGLLLLAIAAYRTLVSPLFHALLGGGGGCRFRPTCSEYAALSIQQHGPWRGGRQALGRLLRCHPFSRGGYDPPTL